MLNVLGFALGVLLALGLSACPARAQQGPKPVEPTPTPVPTATPYEPAPDGHIYDMRIPVIEHPDWKPAWEKLAYVFMKGTALFFIVGFLRRV